MLPVSVLIPTRNAGEHLPSHVRSINALSHLVEEIVVVDSESTDGSLEYLRDHLRHDRLKILSFPPGLYQSWNYGIQNLNAEFTYIATVGDGVDADGLEALVECARALAADVVVSPPTFHNDGGEEISMDWPVHRFIRNYNLNKPVVVSSPVWHIWNALLVPYTLLGSSASNLYRTAALKTHPFPLDYGSLGDTAWALDAGARLRTAIAPRVLSRFMIHDTSASASPQGDPVLRKLHKLAAKSPDSAPWISSMSGEARTFLERARAFSAAMDNIFAMKAEHRELRRRPEKFILPRYWQVKSHRSRNKRIVSRVTNELPDQVPLDLEAG